MKINRDVYLKYVRSCKEDTVLFKEGETGREMYIIISGEVEIRKQTSSSTAKTLTVFREGDIFGEMALIDKKPRSATAVTTRPTRLLVINEALMGSMIGANPDFAAKLIKILSGRLRKANAIIQTLMVTNQQNQILNGLMQYAKESGMSTYKGFRVNVEQFVAWARDHLGIKDAEVQSAVQGFLRRGEVKPSATGKGEILVEPRRGSAAL